VRGRELGVARCKPSPSELHEICKCGMDSSRVSSSPLVGVCLRGESAACSGNVVETLYVTPDDRSQLSLTCIREKISPASVLSKKFVFLNSHGWEVNPKLEHLVKLSEVSTEENTVNIKICPSKPRIGIRIDHNETAIGFVSCDFASTVQDLANEISGQLPELYGDLKKCNFCFLDRNGWPIARNQEQLLTVLEITSSSSVKIRLRQSIFQFNSEQTPSRKVSTAASESGYMITEERDRKRRYSVPEQFTRQFSRALPPIDEGVDLVGPTWSNLADYSEPMISEMETETFQILLSYVHTEASVYALQIKSALEVMGYSVFLDIHCIEGGKDWQDVLNNAITNCSLFVPLITLQYGQTLWTNREVKLADVLGKLILPVNFNLSWPPKCLAIQFATTQYIPSSKYLEGEEVTPENFTEDIATKIAVDVADRFRIDWSAVEVVSDGESSVPLLSQQSTEILSPQSAELNVPLNLGRRRSAIKSYASNLPESVPKDIQRSVLQSKEGKPLVVMSCSEKQSSFASMLSSHIEEKGYDVWCSCDITSQSEEKKSLEFQDKVNSAGAVIFILSKEFAEDVFCEQQVYYCEQRKRIIPILFDSLEMPNWMATLIGTNTFVNLQSQNYLKSLMDRLNVLLNPQKAESELKEVLHHKLETAQLCKELESKLPEGKHVYISGGTRFFSKNGEAICRAIGKELARNKSIILITGGFFGVGETVGRSFFEERQNMQEPHGVCHVVAVSDDEDKSKLTRQNSDKKFLKVPYGDTVFCGSSVRQRETLLPKIVDLCILVEGGPGAAFETQQFVWNGHRVVPIQVTGGAAGGMFNVPSSISVRPPKVKESDWALLGDDSASPEEIAAAVGCIVQILKDPEDSPAALSRSSTFTKDTPKRTMKRAMAMIKRSDTQSSIPTQNKLEKSSTEVTLDAVKKVLNNQTRLNRSKSDC